MAEPIPVTVVGGYLGSGKTTLVNQLLRQADSRIAVLVNDFGEIGIDADLIAGADGDTITLTNGCVCCQIGSDLMSALWSVRDRAERPEHVIIEASGIADPGPVAHYAMTPGFTLDGVVVLLDAETVRKRERHPVLGRTIRRQFAAADVLVLTKTDLVSDADVHALDEWIAARAPGVPVLHARDGRVPLSAVTGIEHRRPTHNGDAAHESDYAQAGVTLDEPVGRERLERFLDGLPTGVVRAKGILRLTESPDQRTVVHRVGVRSTIVTEGHWHDGEPGRLVLIALAGTPVGDLVHELFVS